MYGSQSRRECFYVTRHAEKLRAKFVKHDGKKNLVVWNELPFNMWDVGSMAEKIIPLMEEHMAGKDVRDWLLPNFSTTTDDDRAISSMVMMATMKHYFSYVMRGGCGFPSVTLQGEASDWEGILKRLDKFADYGTEPAAWSLLLKPIIKRFIATFFLPDSSELKEFWMHAVHSAGEWGSGDAVHSAGEWGSGDAVPTLDGWLTAFMYWDKEGVRTLEAPEGTNGTKAYVLDGETFPLIIPSMRGLPTGVVEVPGEFV
jgi:hypothetical protein